MQSVNNDNVKKNMELFCNDIAIESRRGPAQKDWHGDERGWVLIQPQAKFIYLSLLLTEKTALTHLKWGPQP